MEQTTQSPSDLAAFLLARAPMGALVVMKSGWVVHADGALEASMGHSPGSVCGRALVSLLDDEAGPGPQELSRAISQPEARALLVRLKSARHGEPPRSATALVQAEDEVSRQTGCRAVYIKAATAAVEEARDAGDDPQQGIRPREGIDRFLARICHELKTPLNAVIGFSELLLMDAAMPACPSRRDRVQTIRESAWYLNELGEVLRPAINMLRAEALKRDISFGFAVEPGVGSVKAHKTRMEQVVVNLLSNAVKYNRDGGTISVEVFRTASGAVAIEVRNTGAVLSDAQLARLFEPFNRLGWETTATPGSGIGLALCRRLVEIMGGTLTAWSSGDALTTFRLVLPAAGPGG